MVWTADLVEGRFDLSTLHAENAIEQATEYMEQLETLLASLVLPDTEALDDIDMPVIPPIDYDARPSFSDLLESFPSFDNEMPELSNLSYVPTISSDIKTEDITFTENTYSMESLSIGSPPEDNVVIESIAFPSMPDFTIPKVPILADIEMPDEPIIDLPGFDATLSTLTDITSPTELNHTDQAYNSDIRVPLFAKILYDIANGGTGLDATVEADIYDRGRERQRVENERLFREVEDQYSATGFTLPPGSLASRILEVSNEISRKTDQLNWEIAINQADLAQKNTQFTTDQARQIEASLMDFYNTQQNRLFEAAKATALLGVEIFNALVTKEKLKLEIYQTEASVFETKIKAELTAVEIYKTKVEAVKVKSDIQQARINIYLAEIGGIESLIKLYTAEMESARIKTEIQKLKIEIFQAQIEAYAAGIGAEKLKVDIYSAQIDSEKSRAAVYGERVKAYGIKIDAQKAELEAEQIAAENILKTNQLLISQYTAEIEGYKAEIYAEATVAGIGTEAFKASVAAYEAETNAQSMEYSIKIKEVEAQIELVKARVEIAIAEIGTVHSGYVALKDLQVKGTEGMMNANAQLAASAMNAVNVSASQRISSSTTTTIS